MFYHPQHVADFNMDASGGATAPYMTTQGGRGSQGHAPNARITDPNMLMNQYAAMSLGPVPMGANGPISMGPSQAFMIGPDGQYLLAPMAQPMGMPHANEGGYQSYPMAPSGPYNPSYLGMPVPMMPYTPGRGNGVAARPERGHGDNPGLDNRRGSYSTTESTPATPFYGAAAHREAGPRVANLDRSAWTTPSPQALGMSSIHADAPFKPALSSITDRVLDELLNKEPPVPRAVPAVFTPANQMKSLEQSLENRIPGNRNVYIRGLHPTTDDALLYRFASRFGGVETSKAIIDTATGACKGFGFAKFIDGRDSEKCIRGFHRLGYEVGFARESFNSRLKAEGDQGSTNLYISNLPKSLTEVELSTIFLGFTILSSKILRDSMGNSRGVGFARFESRDVCDEVIRKFHGVGIGSDGLLMNIRYADTPAQKELKRVTAERRQFRTNEYNIGAYGTSLVGMSPTLLNQQSHWRRTIPNSRSGYSSSSRDGGNATSQTGSQNGQSQTAASTNTDPAISSPSSSDCDESVTIKQDLTAVGVVVHASAQSSPSAKKGLKTEPQ